LSFHVLLWSAPYVPLHDKEAVWFFRFLAEDIWDMTENKHLIDHSYREIHSLVRTTYDERLRYEKFFSAGPPGTRCNDRAHHRIIQRLGELDKIMTERASGIRFPKEYKDVHENPKKYFRNKVMMSMQKIKNERISKMIRQREIITRKSIQQKQRAE